MRSCGGAYGLPLIWCVPLAVLNAGEGYWLVSEHFFHAGPMGAALVAIILEMTVLMKVFKLVTALRR